MMKYFNIIFTIIIICSIGMQKLHSQTSQEFDSLTQKMGLTKREKQDFQNNAQRELIIKKIQNFITDKKITEYNTEQKYKYSRIYLVRTLVYEYYATDKSQFEIEDVQNYKWLFEKNKETLLNNDNAIKIDKTIYNNILRDSLGFKKQDVCKIKKIENFDKIIATLSVFLEKEKFLSSEKRREISKNFIIESQQNPHLYNALLWANNNSSNIISDYYIIKNMSINPPKEPIQH